MPTMLTINDYWANIIWRFFFKVKESVLNEGYVVRGHFVILYMVFAGEFGK